MQKYSSKRESVGLRWKRPWPIANSLSNSTLLSALKRSDTRTLYSSASLLLASLHCPLISVEEVSNAVASKSCSDRSACCCLSAEVSPINYETRSSTATVLLCLCLFSTAKRRMFLASPIIILSSNTHHHAWSSQSTLTGVHLRSRLLVLSRLGSYDLLGSSCLLRHSYS